MTYKNAALVQYLLYKPKLVTIALIHLLISYMLLQNSKFFHSLGGEQISTNSKLSEHET